MGQEAIALGVSMERGGNVLDLGEGLDIALARIQARLPAALVSGRIDASVGAMAANV